MARALCSLAPRSLAPCLLALLVPVLGGCASYQPGALLDRAPAHARVVSTECLDIQIVHTRDVFLAQPWPVIVYRIGNRCLAPVDLRLGRVTALGDAGGRLVDLRVHDPRGELRVAQLDGRSAAVESIAYEAPEGVELGRVCLSLAELTLGAPSEPICLDRRLPDEDEDEEDGEHEDDEDEDDERWLPGGALWDARDSREPTHAKQEDP